MEIIKIVLLEADLSGIDELVYNPITGHPADEFDKGADNGQVKNKITWANHDNHLHIGATNREVMMQLIDKADSMGLKTTENPYAKKDPNGKVDRVHAGGSFHYKTFQGTPLVGGGVDISGDKSKVREFIRWVNANYRNKKLSVDPFTNDTVQQHQQVTTSHVDSGDQQIQKVSNDGDDILSSMLQGGLNLTSFQNTFTPLKEEINRIKQLLK